MSIFRIFTALFLALGITSISSSAKASCGDVTIAEMNWASAQVIAHIDATILEYGYGCDVELIPGDTMPTSTSLIEKGEPSIAPELWSQNLKQVLDPAEAEGLIKNVGKVFQNGGEEGLWVPTYLAEAEGLASIVNDTGLVFAVKYNYSGYTMVRQAREMIQNGDLGELRVIQIEYAQGWLATDIEKTGHKQALWRTNPTKAGIGGAIGDIGTHAFHLSEFVTGLQVKDLLADLDSMVSGRELDDNANILMKYTNDVKGMLWVSQIATGKENGLGIRVFGTKAGIEWSQENPNFLKYSRLGESLRTLSRGGPSIGSLAGDATRIPSGHPEGFIEGFANIYSDTADLIIAHRSNSKISSLAPTINDGIRGMQFIETAVKSSTSGGVWLSFGS